MPFLNLRVDDIEKIIKKMKEDKVEIISDITNYDYGKFATFKDIFGNVVELWEANPDAYIKLVEKEIENYKITKKPMV